MFHNCLWGLEVEDPDCDICQFLWYKSSYQGQFQATNTKSLNVDWGKDVPNNLLWPGMYELALARFW